MPITTANNFRSSASMGKSIQASSGFASFEFEYLYKALDLFAEFMQNHPRAYFTAQHKEHFYKGEYIGFPSELKEFFETYYPTYDYSIDGLTEYFGLNERNTYFRFMEVFFKYAVRTNKIPEADDNHETGFAIIEAVIDHELATIKVLWLYPQHYRAFNSYAVSNIPIPATLLESLKLSLEIYINDQWEEYLTPDVSLTALFWKRVRSLNIPVISSPKERVFYKES